MKRGRRGAYDWRQKITRSRGRFHTAGTKPYEWREGVVATEHGYVHVYAEPGYTRYTAMVDGVEYSLSESKTHTDRGMAIVAGNFIRRLVWEVGS